MFNDVYYATPLYSMRHASPVRSSKISKTAASLTFAAFRDVRPRIFFLGFRIGLRLAALADGFKTLMRIVGDANEAECRWASFFLALPGVVRLLKACELKSKL